MFPDVFNAESKVKGIFMASHLTANIAKVSDIFPSTGLQIMSFSESLQIREF